MKKNIREFIKEIWFNNPLILFKRKKYIEKIRTDFNYESTPTILSSNCIAGIIYNNLGLQFKSPTINLYIKGNDFIKFVSRLKFYLNCELELQNYHENGYPIAKLHDIIIHFNHYDNFEIAKEKWESRKERIDYNNIYIITHDNGLSNIDKRIYSEIKAKKKIMFTNKDSVNYDFLYKLKRYEKDEKVGQYALRDVDGFREFEKSFNYANWLND